MDLKPPQLVQPPVVTDPAEVRLEIEIDADAGTSRFELDLHDDEKGVHGVVTLGRSMLLNTIVLPSPIIAKRHVRVEVRGFDVFATDLANTSMTWLTAVDERPSLLRATTAILPYQALWVGRYLVRCRVV